METWLGLQPDRLEWFTCVDGVLRRQAMVEKCGMHEPFSFWELGLADDLALLTDRLSKLLQAHVRFQEHTQASGISCEKTEALASLAQPT